jgi:multiple sugar transport system substrate-binding protein
VSRRRFLSGLAAVALPVVAACSAQPAAPAATPQTIEKVVTQVVEKQVTQVVEKQVTQVVEKQVTQVVEKQVIVTATPVPTQAAAPKPSGPVTVELMYSGAADETSPQTKILRTILDTYQKEHAGVTVKQTDMPWVEQRDIIVTRIVSGSAPDMAIIHANYAADLGGSMNAIEPMENFPDFQTFAQAFIPSRLATTEVKGKHWGVPWQGLVFGIAYNKKIFNEVGAKVPETWDDLKQVAKAVTIPGKRYGIGWVMSQKLDTGYRIYPLVLKNGGRMMDDGVTKYIFDNDQNVEAVNLMIDIRKEGATVPGMESWTLDQEGQITQGQTAVMVIGGPWTPIVMKQYAPDWDLMRVPLPAKPSGSQDPATLSDDIMLSIFHLGPAKEAAYDVTKALRTPQADVALWLGPDHAGGLPVISDALKDPQWQSYWAHDVFEHELNHAVPWPYSTNLAEAQTIYSLAISRAFSGQATVKQALSEGVNKANEGLKK